MGERLDAFHRFRTEMNEKILAHDNLVVRRFFNLDGQAYKPGALSSKVKEMLGLVASLVLRCDDCITYHNPGWKAARSYHPGGVNVLFCDGHATFVRDGVAPPTWRAIATRAGGEVVSSDAL